MNLTADRLEVLEGERLLALAIVHTPAPALAVAGGLPHLRHTLEDIGFRDVELRTDAPAWFPDAERPALASLESLMWIEATPARSMSLTRDLTEDLTVIHARAATTGDAQAPDAPHASNPPHAAPLGVMRPYGVTFAIPVRLAGVLWVFGVAYPIAIPEGLR